MTPGEWAGCFTLMIVIALANAGGIGGGGLLIPIFIVLFQFNAIQSVPLSNFSILTAAIVRLAINFR